MYDTMKINARWKSREQFKKLEKWRRCKKQTKEEIIGGRYEF